MPVLTDSPAKSRSAGLTELIGDSAPYLKAFTAAVLLLVYGYEIFNFSLSIDEELYGSLYEDDFRRVVIAQGRWGLGILSLLFPPIGALPMVSTFLFCAGLGVSACILARVLFRKYSAQYAFAGLFVSAPLWPHVAQFNTISWAFAIACCLLTLALLFFQSGRPFGDTCATALLILATGIYQTFFLWFFVLVVLRHLSKTLGTGSIQDDQDQEGFPWLRSGMVALAGLLGYVAIGRLLLAAFTLKLTYVQQFVRLEDFAAAPRAALVRIFHRSWNLLTGPDPVYLGYGRLLTLLPLVGLVVLMGRLLSRGTLKLAQRLEAGAVFAGVLLLVVAPIVLSAGYISSRSLAAWIPLSSFLGGIAFAHSGRFERPLYVVLGAILLFSMWVSVSLFYADHLVRERDEFLAGRIMNRVDNILPNPPPSRIPFIVIGAVPDNASETFRKLEVFGDSFFENTHEGGNPWRVAAYLTLLGVDNLEPRPVRDATLFRPLIESMPEWPAANSIAMVNGLLVIKLGPLPPS